jgi:hypothetical protein
VSDSENNWKSTLFFGGLVALAAAGAAVYAFFIQPWWDSVQLLNQSGTPHGSAFGDGVVALIDDVDTEHNIGDDRPPESVERMRVTVLDVSSGAKLGEHLFSYGEANSGECAAPVDGRVWCAIGDLAVHDARTFARLASAVELIQKAGLPKPLPGSWAVDGAQVSWLLSDGRAAVIDAKTLTAKASNEIPAAIKPNPITNRPRESGYLKPQGRCDMGTLPTAENGWTITEDGARATVKKGRAKNAGETYLQPAILETTEDAAFVLHHSSLDKQEDHSKISLIRQDGNPTWTVDLTGQCESWRLNGNSLVVVTQTPGARTLAIDIKNGAIQWKQKR